MTKGRWIVFLGIVCAQMGCSLEDPRKELRGSGLKIELQETASSEAQSYFSIMTAPTAIGDFNCFAVNVTGPGVGSGPPINDCVSPNNFNGRGLGITSQPATRNTSIELDVRAGKDRRIDVYGIYPPASQCGGSGTGTQDAYLLGTKLLDLFEAASVTIPISFSPGTQSSIQCSNNQTVNSTTLSIAAANPDATTGGSCTSTMATPPTTPAPPSGPVATSSSSLYSAQDGSLNNEECIYSGPDNQTVQFKFSTSGLNLSLYTQISVKWVGRSGMYPSGGGCPGNPSSVFTSAGGSVWVYNYNGGTGPTWIQVGSNTAATSGTETLNGSYGFLPNFPFSDGYIYVRVVGPSVASTQCSVVSTDYVEVKLN